MLLFSIMASRSDKEKAPPRGCEEAFVDFPAGACRLQSKIILSYSLFLPQLPYTIAQRNLAQTVRFHEIFCIFYPFLGLTEVPHFLSDYL